MTRHSSNVFGAAIASARPAGPPPREPYTGAELSRSNLRAGSYDTAALPSVMSGRLQTLAEMRAERLGPIPTIATTREVDHAQ